MKNIVIIGGGASGLFAAIHTAKVLREKPKNDVQIIILERCDKVARKLLATGNGRCNITNINMKTEFFHSNDIELAGKILEKFTLTDTMEFFKNIGLMLRVEADGKVYPYSMQAATVLDILRNAAAELGVIERCSFEVALLTRMRKGFMIKSKSGETLNADVVIMASGGCASPRLGSNGSGYQLMEKLGHRTSDIFPAIIQIRTETDVVKSLQGIKVDGKLTLKIDDNILHDEIGEVLFTEFGLSGPIAFNIARKVGEEVRSKGNKADIYAVIDFIPEMSPAVLIDFLESRTLMYSGKTLEQFVLGIINKRVGQAVVKVSGFKLTDDVSLLKDSDLEKLAMNFKGMKIKCIGTQSFQNAQVTAGGILLNEFDYETLESKLIPDLYACGEILDVDGDCGGYNLQWAWSSGYVVGMAVGNKY